MSPKAARTEPFTGRAPAWSDPRQFYRIGEAGFAIPAVALEEHDDMYYCITANNVEIPEVQVGDLLFQTINVWDILESLEPQNLRLDSVGPMFRVRSESLIYTFCSEGIHHPGDQFRTMYDECGFLGLEFDEVLIN